MTLFAKMLLYIYVFIAVAGLSEQEEYDNSESFFTSVIELRNENGTVLDYATKIQALFCPEQPICTDMGVRNRTDVLNTLPKAMEIGIEDIRIEDVHEVVGACCLPCSCDADTCKEDGNCCLTKVFLDAVGDNPDVDVQKMSGALGLLNDVPSEFEGNQTNLVHSECIKASRMSYRDKDAFDIESELGIPSYFMITQCFENHTSDLEVKKCQSPSEDEVEDTLPVTSSNTGRSYWNSHCARCNNDGSSILPWNVWVKFDFDIAFFVNESNTYGSVYPEMPDDLLGFISETGDIIYVPPFPRGEKLCLRKTTLYTCKIPRTKTTDVSWLNEACEQIYSPFVIENIFGRIYPFQNVFCYLCRKQYIKPSDKSHCGYTENHGKGKSGGLTALLDYRALSNRSDAKSNSHGSRDETCDCDEIYDRYLVSACISFSHVFCQVRRPRKFSSKQENNSA